MALDGCRRSGMVRKVWRGEITIKIKIKIKGEKAGGVAQGTFEPLDR
jgi:hypothetical protein